MNEIDQTRDPINLKVYKTLWEEIIKKLPKDCRAEYNIRCKIEVAKSWEEWDVKGPIDMLVFKEEWEDIMNELPNSCKAKIKLQKKIDKKIEKGEW